MSFLAADGRRRSCGVSHGLTALWNVLRARGARRVAVEDPGWRWQRFTVERAGLEAVPVRVDGDGLIVAELARTGADAVVLTPAHQYPTGVVMSAERRGALIAWARDRGALIVEDDYDAEYRFDRDPVASLQGLAPDQVAFVGTTSKTLAPALRLGRIVAPADLLIDVADEFRVTGVTPPTLDQIAMASFIADAGLDRRLRIMRRRYRASATSGSTSCADTSPGCGSAASPLGCTSWPGFPTRATSMPRPRGSATPASASMSCITTAPPGRSGLRRCCSGMRCRPNRRSGQPRGC